jgi:ABC-2 type transport system ATP-binding protein
MTAPLLSAKDARVAVDGTIAIESLTVTTVGDRVVLAGDVGALFAAISGVPRSAGGGGRVAGSGGDDGEMPGEAYVVGGTLRVDGHDVATGAHVAAVGAAPLDPPLPPAWTAEEYVSWGARLAGVPRGDAKAMAVAALTRTGLAPARRKKLGALSLPERRALGLAQAIASGPAVLLAEAPLRDLMGGAAGFVLEAVAAAAEGRRAAISVARLDAGSAEGALARGASHLLVLSGGELSLEGPPGELFAGARIYALTVRSNAGALQVELAARGIALRGGPVRFSAAVPAGLRAPQILEAARAARAAVVEMVPLIG